MGPGGEKGSAACAGCGAHSPAALTSCTTDSGVRSVVKRMHGEKDVWVLWQLRPRVLDLAPAICCKEH